jgi:hypothetical protein
MPTSHCRPFKSWYLVLHRTYQVSVSVLPNLVAFASLSRHTVWRTIEYIRCVVDLTHALQGLLGVLSGVAFSAHIRVQ